MQPQNGSLENISLNQFLIRGFLSIFLNAYITQMRAVFLTLFYFIGLCWGDNLFQVLKSHKNLTHAAFFADSYEYLLSNPANVTILVPNNDAVFRLKNVFPDYVKSLANSTAKILELSSCKNLL